MISGTVIALGVVLGCLIYFVFLRKPRWKNTPPGPRGLPLIGHILQLDKFQHVTFSKWAKEYGPLCKLNFGSLNMVIVSDYKMLKEMFSYPAFSGRMDFSEFDFIMDGKVHGIINTEGEHWEELRRFTLRQLRDFGFGKGTMEDSIMLEVHELIEGRRHQGASASGRGELVVGHSHGDKAQTECAFDEIIEGGGALILMPWLVKFFPRWTGYTKMKHALAELADYMRQPGIDHEKTRQDDFDRYFTDAFLNEIAKTTDPNSAFMGKVGVDHLAKTLGDLYFAGTDTTATTLSWMMLYLSKFPEILEKFQKEIESIMGNSRSTILSDRPNMPYTEALIAETLRFSTITPQGVQHRAMKDQEYKGYLIPKDTVITANVHYIHFDPKVWTDPENFRPDRFLSPDGKTFKKHDALIPFSTGRGPFSPTFANVLAKVWRGTAFSSLRPISRKDSILCLKKTGRIMGSSRRYPLY
ncbi:cytochrome P450 2J5-like [Folsomia candida]|uniref:cytochrome P450 2J5-like n=1 Tax=Folsomia candida TaxID=158441 RepID=UPI001604E2B2|nr:cytochrome P450 2J5-like [Folsomia candida]